MVAKTPREAWIAATPRRAWFAAALALSLATACAPARTNTAFRGGDGAWRDPIHWRDGKAEKCVYSASREIYGIARQHRAIAYTNVERYDARTTTKSENDSGREVFKHHWSETIPTENYDYRFSTMSYVDAASMAAVKLTVGTQEDCGASFKQVWLEGDDFAYWDSVYFPGAGVRSGTLGAADSLHFFDALTLLLRDYDFENRPELRLDLVPSQKTTRQAPFERSVASVRYVASERVELPFGVVDTHRLRVEVGEKWCEYWFAADAKAPRLRVLVRLEDSDGVRCELVEQTRTAYWERP